MDRHFDYFLSASEAIGYLKQGGKLIAGGKQIMEVWNTEMEK